jgi:hypothetical protein
LYYRLPSVGTYNNRNYTSSGGATFTVTAGQSYIVHLDGVIQPSSVYSINTTVLTFSTPPVSGSVVEIREMSSLINERIYTGSGATYTVTPSKAVLVYINNVIQENVVDYNVLGSTIVISSVLTSSDTLMILELDDDVIDKDGIGDGSNRNFTIVANANNNNSLVYVSGVYQMPTTNYTVT